MKHIQPSTPGFVLTSLAFSRTETKNNSPLPQRQRNTDDNHSSIAKFDYCLPPDEFNYPESNEGLPTA